MNEEQQVGFSFQMPLNGTLKIMRSSYSESWIEAHEKIDGIFYRIYWNDKAFYLKFETEISALGAAMMAQYAAQQMFEKLN